MSLLEKTGALKKGRFSKFCRPAPFCNSPGLFYSLSAALVNSALVFSTISAKAVEPTNKPLYEFGVYGGAGYRPDYPASGQQRLRYIIVPAGVYRGDVFRAAEREGLLARILQSTTFQISLSFSGSFATQNGENQARSGMPELDWLVEVGPKVVFRLYHEPQVSRLSLELPVRQMLSTNFSSLAARGWLFNPSLVYRRFAVWGETLDFFARLEATWASEGVASYFYHVGEGYVTAARPRYDAVAGLLESALEMGVSARLERWHLFFGAWVNRYDGSANQPSPLFKSYGDVGAFVGAGYWFYQASEKGFD